MARAQARAGRLASQHAAIELAKRLQFDVVQLITLRMYRLHDRLDPPTSGVAIGGRVIALAQAKRGDAGVIVGVCAAAVEGRLGKSSAHGVSQRELEQRLLEIGFVEGARVDVLHEGPFGRDPIAVRVDDMRIALRRREAAEVMIALDPHLARR